MIIIDNKVKMEISDMLICKLIQWYLSDFNG